MFDRPRGPPRVEDFGELFLPDQAAPPILARPVRDALTEWLTEIWAEAELTELGVKPRRRAIFDGPPGVGKTTLAHHLAARLGLPMLAVRPDRVIDKWVGSTGRNIGELFEAVRRGLADPDSGAAATLPVVLFLDEFDALAVTRRRANSGADEERNAYVNTLLQRLEQHGGVVVAATNHGAHVDPAIWRRFDIHIALELPGQEEREKILARYLDPLGLPRTACAALAEALDGASPALIRALCENLKRMLIIGPKLGQDMSRAAVFGRVLVSCHPHPDLGKPRLWSHGPADKALSLMPWPLPTAAAAADADRAPAAAAARAGAELAAGAAVVPLRRPAR